MAVGCENRFQTASGNKVKLFLSLLPLCDREEPRDVLNMILASSISIGQEEMELVTPINNSIAAGTSFSFVVNQKKCLVTLAEDAIPGQSTLLISPFAARPGTEIPVGSVTNHIAKLRLLGGTQLDTNGNLETVDTVPFEDETGADETTVVSSKWELPWKANLLAADPAYRRLFSCILDAVNGRELYIWQYDAPPPTALQGDGLEGAALALNYSKNFQTKAIVGFGCTFKIQGTPKQISYIP